MSIIKIHDIAHVRFSAPDLGEMHDFLTEFGLRAVSSEKHEKEFLFMRGSGPAPFIHVTSIGPPSFIGLGLRAGSVSDLERLALEEGAPIEDFDAPGGGQILRLLDPDGFNVEVVAGQTDAAAIQVEAEQARNSAQQRSRLRAPLRINKGSANVFRLGHAVLNVTDFRRSEEWYKTRFGFITSDDFDDDNGATIGAFLRCDLGEALTDHHTLCLAQTPTAPSFNHAGFEVESLDDLMRGHAHLKSAKRTPTWGIGRHILGSQIFDYWNDPWGHELEHWTDGDLFSASDKPNKAPLEDVLDVQWGPLNPMFANSEGSES